MARLKKVWCPKTLPVLLEIASAGRLVRHGSLHLLLDQGPHARFLVRFAAAVIVDERLSRKDEAVGLLQQELADDESAGGGLQAPVGLSDGWCWASRAITSRGIWRPLTLTTVREGETDWTEQLMISTPPVGLAAPRPAAGSGGS